MDRVIVTTSWDDASILDLKLAELLEKHNLKGTFYIPKSYLDNTLSREDIKTIDDKFEIGCHTQTHVDLTAISLEEAEKEIINSKDYLEEVLGHRVLMFCYPKGRYRMEIKELVRSSGFIAARTSIYKGFNLPEDPYEWGITLHAHNGSPLTTLKTWLRSGICLKSGISIRSLLDWEIRAKLLFDLALDKKGVYHLWGHSWEIEREYEWPKLERVLEYISARSGVSYMTNGEIFSENRKTRIKEG
ncbi:MAG: polysaccharide deacetylase family protein [bacterium]